MTDKDERTFIATMAMQAIVSSHWWRPSNEQDTKNVAAQAVKLADALLAELEEECS